MTVVDVVVTARDEQRHLPACLESIRRQRGADFGLIVVDDGSIDDTTSIVEAAAAEDDRVTVIRHDIARGLAAARNAGLARSRAPWVTFVDGDDLLFPGALEHRLATVATAPGDTLGAYGDWVSIPERTRRLLVRRRPTGRPDAWLVTANKRVPFIASAPVLARDVLVALGGFDPRCTTGEDADLWQWWLRLQGRTAYSRHLCVAYRRRAGSMTRRDLSAHFRANRDAFASLDEWLPDEAPSAVLRADDARYRSEMAHQPRALLAAAVAFADGRHTEVSEVLAELDPIVLRVAGPTRCAHEALAAARRRIRGTAGARPALRLLADSRVGFARVVEEAAAPPATREELVAAAAWLRTRRELPDAVEEQEAS